jgi:aspartate aminotransferase
MIRKMDNLASQMIEKVGAENVHNFTLGNPRVPPPKEYTDALKEVANEEYPLCHGYSSTVGDIKARRAFADLFTELQGLKVEPEHIILCSGCAGAMNVFLRTVLSVLDEVILITPYFLEYPFYVENFHGVVREVRTSFDDGWQINPQIIERAVNPLTRVVIINSPHNPTGIILTQDTITKMCEVLKRKSEEYGRPIWVLSDDVYARVIAPGAETHKIFQAYDYSAIAYSLSKDLSLPGERIGALCVNPRLKNNALFVHSAAHANEILGFVHANRIHMRIVPKVLPAKSAIHLYDESREIIMKLFDELGLKYVKPTGAFYIFPKIPDGCDEWTFCKTLAENCIVVVPGSAFREPGFMRISFCKPPQDIERAIPVFKKAFAAALKACGK